MNTGKSQKHEVAIARIARKLDWEKKSFPELYKAWKKEAEMTEIDTWVAGCKVRAFDWIDGKSIYMNVRYFAPGQSLERAPALERSVLIPKTPENEDRIRTHLHSIVEGTMKGATR